MKVAMEGAEIVVDAANARAPGPHIQVQIDEVGKEHVRLRIGPDRAHWYYRFIEYGAQAHTILPKNRQALWFPGGDLAMHAEHPGFAARPFLRPALDDNKDDVTKAMGRAYWAAITRAV